MNYTLEQKVDICLRYIAATNPADINACRKLAIEALTSGSVLSKPIVIQELIDDLLTEIGVSPLLIGYTTITHALCLIIEDPTCLLNIDKRLYVEVAELMGDGYSSIAVERGICRAVEATFNRGDLNRIHELFGNSINVDSGKLSNGEFLACCAREIRRRMRRGGIV